MREYEWNTKPIQVRNTLRKVLKKGNIFHAFSGTPAVAPAVASLAVARGRSVRASSVCARARALGATRTRSSRSAYLEMF